MISPHWNSNSQRPRENPNPRMPPPRISPNALRACEATARRRSSSAALGDLAVTHGGAPRTWNRRACFPVSQAKRYEIAPHLQRTRSPPAPLPCASRPSCERLPRACFAMARHSQAPSRPRYVKRSNAVAFRRSWSPAACARAKTLSAPGSTIPQNLFNQSYSGVWTRGASRSWG